MMWLINGRAKSRLQKKWETLTTASRALQPTWRNKTDIFKRVS